MSFSTLIMLPDWDIILRMKSRKKGELGADLILKYVPKFGSILCVSIRNNGKENLMKTLYLLGVDFS